MMTNKKSIGAGILAAAIAFVIAFATLGYSAPSVVIAAEEPVPTCVKPGGNPSHAQQVTYAECLQKRTEALIKNSHPVPTVTETIQVPGPTVTETVTVTPSPTPTEEPTPTDPPTSDPPDPEPGAFPTRESVGPAVEPTQTYAGDCYFAGNESGTVIDGKIVNCVDDGLRFAVDAQNIVFKNSVIRGQMLTVGNTPGDAGADQTRAPVFTVEDSRIIQSKTINAQDRAACCAHYVIKRSLMQGTHSGFAAHNNVTLIGNFITTDGTDSHSSGGRTLKNTVLRGNTLVCKPVTAGYDGGCSAAAVFYSERLDGTSAAAFNLTIENNYFKRGVTSSGAGGGPWFATRFINCANRSDCIGIKFTGNQFDLGWGTDGGEFPFYGGNTWANNTWTDGQAATSGQSR